MSDERLKPCPFCNGTPIMDCISDAIAPHGVLAWWVVCSKCGIRTEHNHNKGEVVKAWNRRSKDD